MNTSSLLAAALALLLAPALHAGKPQQLTAPDQVPEGLGKSDWHSIRAAYEAGRHAFHAVDGGWQARNPGQQWTTRFDGRGFLATPKDAEWTWGLEFQSYGFGERQTRVSGMPQVRAEGQRLSYQWSDTVEEWFVNDGRGLEHGFTIAERPAGSGENEALVFTLATHGPLKPSLSADHQTVHFRDAASAPVLNYSGLKVWDADGTVLPSRFQVVGREVRLLVDETNARYPITIDPIAQQAYLKASNNGGDLFGYSVSVSGDTVVVGAYGEDSSTTGVNSTPNESSLDSGAAYVFVRSGTTWIQQAYLKASNPGANDRFGISVSVSGDTVVVGAFFEDSSTTGVNSTPNEDAGSSGAAYVFVRSGTTWSQQVYLKASNTGASDWFGYSVSVSGDTVVVGAYQEDSSTTGVNSTPNEGAPDSGAAYVFVRSGTTWSQQAYLKASNTGGSDYFGRSVSVSGDTVVVGAAQEDSSTTGVNSTPNESASASGAAYVFVRSGTTWSQQAYLKASNTGAGDNFGFSLGVSGDTVVVGAYFEDSSTTGVNSTPNESSLESGAAYVFVRSGTTWSQQAYLKASNTGASDRFGSSVSVSGDTVVVGADGEDSSTTGVNPTPNNNAPDSGAAYVFVRSGTTWSHQAYLKASNTGASDRFGSSVSVSGDTVVVGASGEDSSTTGVNSTPDEGVPGSGAVYIFTGLGLPPTISWNIGDGTWNTSSVNWLDANLATTTFFDTLDSVLFGDASGASGNPAITLATSVSPVGVTMNTSGRNYTVSGAGSIGGSGALTLAPANTGTFTLSTANNTFTGGTTVNGGTLVLGHTTDTLPDTGAVVVDGASAILSLGANSDTVGAVSLKNGGFISGSGSTLTGSSYALESGSVTANLGGASALTKSTTGTVILSGANNFTGTTTVRAGTLRLENTGALASTADISLVTANIQFELGTDSAFTTLPGITGGSNLTHTIVSGRATAGAALNHQLGTINFGASTFNFIEGSNVNSGTAGITFASATMTSGIAGTSVINPTSSTLTITGGVTSQTINFARTLQLDGTGTGHSIGGVITQSVASALSLTKSNTSTWTLSGLSSTAASNYSGTTTIDQGTLAFTTTSPSLTGGLTIGASAGATTTGALDLSAVGATFAGAMTVRTDSATANTISIGNSQTLRVNGAVGVGYANTAVATTKLTLSGAGTFTVGAVGSPTNANFSVGGGGTVDISNPSTVDMSGLGNFYANLGSGTFRVGEANNNGGGAGTGGGGSTVVLADISTIFATTLTLDSPTITTHTLKLGSVANEINATTINIGGNNRSGGTLDFNESTGTIKIRNLAGTGPANMNIAYGNSFTAVSVVGNVDFNGHAADLLLGTLSIGGRTRTFGGVGSSTGTFSYDTATGGGLDVTTLDIATRTDTRLTSSNVTGTANLGANFTIGTVTMATNSGAASTTGDAIANLNISGGTNAITTLTMGVNTVPGATGNGSNTDSTINISGGTTTVNTTFTMGAQNSALNAATTVNSALSALNISAGSLVLSGSTNLTMGQTTLDVNNAATAAINITGTGSLTVGGNIQYTDDLGTESNTVTLSGGTLDMTNGNIGAAGALVTLVAESGELKNVAAINGTGGFTKTTAGTLLLSGTISYAGDTTVSEGILTLGSATDPLNANTANDASAVAIASTGATLNLAYTGTDLVDKLFIGSSQLAAGTYGKVGSISPVIGIPQITGDGTLTVASNPTYASWINGFFLFPGETDPAIIGPAADPDFDGIDNGVEMVIGGDPKLGMDSALLPTIELVNADPDGDTTFADYLLFTYRRTDLSVTAGVAADCETDTDLVAPWTAATGAPGMVIQVDDNFTFTPPAAADTDRVRVYVPRAANTTLFGRLDVKVP